MNPYFVSRYSMEETLTGCRLDSTECVNYSRNKIRRLVIATARACNLPGARRPGGHVRVTST